MVRNGDEGSDHELSDGSPDAAARRLYEEYWGPLCKFINASIDDPETTQDLAQRALFHYLKVSRPYVFSQRAFLFAIACNLIKAHFVPRKKDATAHVIDVGPDELEDHLLTYPILELETQIDLVRVLRALPKRVLRTVLPVLRGTPNMEVAQQQGVSQSTVRRRLLKTCNLLEIVVRTKTRKEQDK